MTQGCKQKIFSIHIAPLRPKTQRHLEDTELKQAKSKPDTVNRPVRTARIFVHHYNSTQYYNTETVFYLYSPSSRPTSHLRCGQLEVSGRSMYVVTPFWAQLVPRWVTVFGRVNHLGAEPGTHAYSA